MKTAPLDLLFGRQLGLATMAQLRTAGWTTARLRAAVDRGQLVAERRGVVRVAGAPRSPEQARLAAVLAAPGSVASHLTAASLWALLFLPEADKIDLLRPGNRPRMPGVRGHETDALPAGHIARVGAIPVTSAARTVIDVCGFPTHRQLASSVNDALRRRLFTLPVLARTVDEVPTSGRRAINPLLDYLEHRIPGYDPGDSDPEADLVDLLVNAGYPRPQQQIAVATSLGTLHLDLGWTEVRTAYEYDSVHFHLTKFHEDRARWRAIQRAGWEVWPITSTTTANEILAIASAAFRRERAA